jgi:hypothetical protein
MGRQQRRKSASASPTRSGDALFNFTGQGSDGTKFVDTARIRMEIDGIPGVSSMPGRMTFWTTPNGASATAERMRIDSLGNVEIGTANPTERLHVAGNIRATGSILTQPGPETEIPDYVFESGYDLMPLEALKRYLEKGKHLPNIPDAAEIRENGMNLSGFQLKLVEKVEELTLYTIQQHRASEAKDARILDLEMKNNALAERVASMSSLEAKVAMISTLEARLAAMERLLARQQEQNK